MFLNNDANYPIHVPVAKRSLYMLPDLCYLFITSRYLPTKFTGVLTDSLTKGETAGHVGSNH